MRAVYKHDFELAHLLKEKIHNITQIIEIQELPNLESLEHTTEVIVIYTQDSSSYGTAMMFFEWFPIEAEFGFVSECISLASLVLTSAEVIERTQPYKDIGLRWGINPVDFIQEVLMAQPIFSLS